MKESELHSAIGSLPRSMRPQRDLWPGISQRLETVEREGNVDDESPFWRRPAMAAAVLLALTTGIFIGRGMDVGPADQMTQTVQQYALIGTVKAKSPPTTAFEIGGYHASVIGVLPFQ